MIRCVVFDFDGTVVLSNDIKREGFFAAVSTIPDGHSRMAAILSNPPGDRYAIFERFSAEAGANASDLVDSYSSWCEERILQCPARHGAERVILALKAVGIKVHVNSATPDAPLRSIVARRFGMDFFDGVHGGHGEKARNLKLILELEAIHPGQLVMIGDGTDDWEAASSIGCRFIGVPDGTLASAAYDGPLVGDFDNLWPHLPNGTDDD
jgi:phosphoglycolate phosphatase-like HAD superfamily hydrolase